MNEHALEAAAQAMCDRVNGQGDYAENIGQRRSGWLAQARAGVEAYLAASPEATATASVRELTDVELKDAVSELLSARGERPYRVLRGGQELWKTWLPAFRAAMRYLPTLTDSGTADTHAGSVREWITAAETISRAIDPGAWEDELPGMTRASVTGFRLRREQANEAAARVLAALHPVDSRAQGGEK